MATIVTKMTFKDMVSTALQRMTNNVNNTAKGFESLGGKLVGLNSAMQIFSMASNAVKGFASELEGATSAYQHQLEMEKRLQIVMQTRFGANKQVIDSMKETLNQQEAMTGYSYEMLTNGAQELATYIKDAETLKGLMPVLANMAKQAGVETEQGMMSYATMLGKVMGGDMGGMSKRGYVFTDEEKKTFELMNEQQRLKFLTDTVTQSIGNQAQALNNLNPQNLNMLNIQMDNIQKELGKVYQPFSRFFQMVSLNWKIGFYKTLISALQFVQKHTNGLVIAMGALATAVIAVGVAYLIMQRQAVASAVASAVAWAIANAPLLATIGIIMAIVGAIALLLAYSENTFPVIGGIIGAIGSIGKEVAMQVKYYFGAMIEGVVNGFLSMKNKIVSAFLSVFDFLLKGIGIVASGMDKVFGTSFADNINNFRETIQQLKNVKSERFTLGWEDNRRGFGNAMKEGYQAGSAVGTLLSNKFKDSIDKLTGALRQKNIEDSLNSIDNKLGGTLDVKDSSAIDITQDYQDFLADKAESLFGVKYQYSSPEINFGGVTISSEVDADNFINRFVNEFKKVAQSTLR